MNTTNTATPRHSRSETALHRAQKLLEESRPDPGAKLRSLSARELGILGEDLAAAHLQAAGMHVLHRNIRLGRGEIDVVALDGRTLVVAEVKTRRSLVTGVPQAAVTAQKLQQLRRLTGQYLQEHSPPHADVRIDVVAVYFDPHGTTVLEHLRGVGA